MFKREAQDDQAFEQAGNLPDLGKASDLPAKPLVERQKV
jgi:hypothetical protein